MGGLFGKLISLKAVERWAEKQLIHMSRPELVHFASAGLARISDDELPHTATHLREIAAKLDAKDRAGAAELIATDLEAARP